MNAGERIVFEATGEARPPRTGDLAAAHDAGVFVASMNWKESRPILRRVSPERVAAEQRVIEEAGIVQEPHLALIRALVDLRAAIAAETPKPRFTVDGRFVNDALNDMCPMGLISEADARRYADELNARFGPKP